MREHSSIALAAVYFLSFPIPLLRLCWGFVAIFVSFTRFFCPLAIHYHFRVIHNNFVYLALAPIVSPPPPPLSLPPPPPPPPPLVPPPPPSCPFPPPPPQTSRSGSFQWSNFNEWLCRSQQKQETMPIYFFCFVFY